MNEFQVFKAGPKEVSSRSKYCRTFVNPKDSDRTYFVEKEGEVRAGKTVSSSQSLTDLIHAKMKLWEKCIATNVN